MRWFEVSRHGNELLTETWSTGIDAGNGTERRVRIHFSECAIYHLNTLPEDERNVIKEIK